MRAHGKAALRTRHDRDAGFVHAAIRFDDSFYLPLTEVDVARLATAFMSKLDDVVRECHRRTQSNVSVAHDAHVFRRQVASMQDPVDAVLHHRRDGLCVTSVHCHLLAELVRHSDYGTHLVVGEARPCGPICFLGLGITTKFDAIHAVLDLTSYLTEHVRLSAAKHALGRCGQPENAWEVVRKTAVRGYVTPRGEDAGPSEHAVVNGVAHGTTDEIRATGVDNGGNTGVQDLLRVPRCTQRNPLWTAVDINLLCCSTFSVRYVNVCVDQSRHNGETRGINRAIRWLAIPVLSAPRR